MNNSNVNIGSLFPVEKETLPVPIPGKNTEKEMTSFLIDTKIIAYVKAMGQKKKVQDGNYLVLQCNLRITENIFINEIQYPDIIDDHLFKQTLIFGYCPELKFHIIGGNWINSQGITNELKLTLLKKLMILSVIWKRQNNCI